jgi:HIV-1 Vpr-binding protein
VFLLCYLQVIINSEVWDLRSFKLLRSVPSLDQTTITFNTTGDVIYATLRRNSDDIMTALHPRRMRHPLFSAFRTMDAVDYSDITTTVVDRCVLDLATEPTDSFISIVAVESNEEMDSFARLYEVGRRRPTDDDSDPDDGGETEEEEEDDDDDDDDDDGELHEDDDIDLVSNDDEENSDEDDDGDEAGDIESFTSDDDGSDDGLGEGVLELISDGDDDPRGTFSSDDGSGGEFGDDAFDDLMRGMF